MTAPIPAQGYAEAMRDADADAPALPDWWPGDDDPLVYPTFGSDAVAPHAAVVVGHSGYGTTLGTLRRGVPLVVTPLFSRSMDERGRGRRGGRRRRPRRRTCHAHGARAAR